MEVENYTTNLLIAERMTKAHLYYVHGMDHKGATPSLMTTGLCEPINRPMSHAGIEQAMHAQSHSVPGWSYSQSLRSDDQIRQRS